MAFWKKIVASFLLLLLIVLSLLNGVQASESPLVVEGPLPQAPLAFQWGRKHGPFPFGGPLPRPVPTQCTITDSGITCTTSSDVAATKEGSTHYCVFGASAMSCTSTNPTTSRPSNDHGSNSPSPLPSIVEGPISQPPSGFQWGRKHGPFPFGGPFPGPVPTQCTITDSGITCTSSSDVAATNDSPTHHCVFEESTVSCVAINPTTSTSSNDHGSILPSPSQH
ncbi:hypothetical protein KC19_8G026000 [Ceratodon purpureus]|uniref:Uncharacterized protein n=1 Tax=Ceratodon purpureus TaxID=3225 RepID=A0A8T0GXU4_CERPU|nr:hypothetical protein KC19_8G026000 [Ceratodon purpureus]